MAIARRLMPFGVKRLLYSGRAAKDYASEVKGEFGRKTERNLCGVLEIIKCRANK